MKLTTEKNGTDLTVNLIGELNTLSAPELRSLFDKELDDVQALTLSFAECDYVSSAGLRILLAAYKYMDAKNGTMVLINVGEGVMEVLQNTSLDGVFVIR